MSTAELLTLLGGSGGGTAIAMLFLFITGQVVPKSTHEDVKGQRDEWKRLYELQHDKAEAGLLAGRIVAEALRPALPAEKAKELE